MKTRTITLGQWSNLYRYGRVEGWPRCGWVFSMVSDCWYSTAQVRSLWSLLPDRVLASVTHAVLGHVQQTVWGEP